MKIYTVSSGSLNETVNANGAQEAATAYGVTHMFHGNVEASFLATQSGSDLYRITSTATGASVVASVTLRADMKASGLESETE